MTKMYGRAILLLYAACCLLPGCNKHSIAVPGAEDRGFCQIKTMYMHMPGRIEIADFYYDHQGKPTRVTVTTTDASYQVQNTPYYFRYDQQGRLHDFIITSKPDPGNPLPYHEDIIGWHRYGYPDAVTVLDTVYFYLGWYADSCREPGVLASPGAYYTHQLDYKGRIVETKVGGYTYTYSYNPLGDKAGFTYDHQPGIYRTNKVWQFVFNDFSTHNILGPTPPGVGKIVAYNYFGLPAVLSEHENDEGSRVNRLNMVGDTLRIKYFCDEGTHTDKDALR
ncbi:hypothetical protein [Chitinophaga nivalis]|uniref:DUF4595 domain-containing protein n=1 Tax=Chitinophaga nivalis TaxID=2991709 RepID=A0ABT3IK65_9BACT|nr:hypothetical protein [Chitinophaga nivalis]MCW3465956.1 hypothetical protein [Chitinophaga nivalis]MCW3484353.1 hypothetical protein [Chitinophaga nivalis]